MRSGRWADTDTVILIPQGARAASFDGEGIELGDCGVARLTLAVSDVTGTGTLNVAIETRENGDAPWRSLGTFPARGTVGNERRSFGGLDRFVRATAAVDAATFTFAVFGEAA
jgi:hypothetical protein